MRRGESSGGGQSSLNYLFGSEEQPSQPPPPKTVSLPPYGIDIDNDNPPTAGRAPSSSTSQVIDRSQGQHLGNILTNRPSTKVKSVPGGHSSLGYLFGDK
ncbi:SPIRAL 2 protein [Spatholobus suberectus]|nr:SPIRAL 2 protein [Spatholobus suberectus]